MEEGQFLVSHPQQKGLEGLNKLHIWASNIRKIGQSLPVAPYREARKPWLTSSQDSKPTWMGEGGILLPTPLARKKHYFYKFLKLSKYSKHISYVLYTNISVNSHRFTTLRC